MAKGMKGWGEGAGMQHVLMQRLQLTAGDSGNGSSWEDVSCGAGGLGWGRAECQGQGWGGEWQPGISAYGWNKGHNSNLAGSLGEFLPL